SRRGVLDRLSGGTDPRVAEVTAATDFVKAANTDPKRALSQYEGLSPSLKKDKMVMLALVRAAQQLDEDRYLRVLAEYRALFRGDPTVELISLDYFILHHRYDEALAGLEHIRSSEGSDAYLDVMRANVCILKHDLECAERAIEKAESAEPELKQILLGRLS